MKTILSTLVVISGITAAQALPLDFNGGSGTPVTVTLEGKIDYTITTASNSQTLAFLFTTPTLTNFAGLSTLASVDLYFTVNNHPYQFQLNDAISTRYGSTTALNFVSVDPLSLAIGDKVTLWAGSAITAVNIQLQHIPDAGRGHYASSFDWHV
jgi:hypothetical protein